MLLESPHGRALELGNGRTRIMGVLNVTPDSFSDGGRFLAAEDAVRRGEQMVAAGAAVLDIGGESTRPGYQRVAAEEQLARILPVLEALRPRVEVPISVDTTLAAVAAAALDAGADWINDTTALTEDPEIAAVAAVRRCPVVLMHRFSPARQPGDAPPSRASVTRRIAENLSARVRDAIERGIDESRILLDPGIGFGTLVEDNVVIHAHIADLRALGKPLVVGPSRKSFLGQLTGREVGDRLAATAACVAALAVRGVELVRVHDVAAMQDVVRVTEAIQRAENT